MYFGLNYHSVMKHTPSLLYDKSQLEEKVLSNFNLNWYI